MPVSDSDGLYLAGSSFRETSGYSRATRESLPTSACNTQKTPADGLRQVARSKGFDEASGGVRYRRCECVRRAGQVGCAVARPVSKQSRTLARHAGANVVDAHGIRRTSHVPVRNRREHEPRATLMRAANPPPCLPGGSAPAARHSSSRPIENSSPAGRRMHASRRPTISGNPPVNIGRHPHFGRCHWPTVSLRLTTGHRGRMASEQAGRPAIPSRNQHMPTQSTDTASAYDGVRCVR